jgi:hypothetical protein
MLLPSLTVGRLLGDTTGAEDNARDSTESTAATPAPDVSRSSRSRTYEHTVSPRST